MTFSHQSVVTASLYRDGVLAIEQITDHFDQAQWDQPACGTWSAAETARHLVGVVGWYHEWLDNALVGTATQPFAESEFEVRNASIVAQLRGTSGPDAVAEFAVQATRYLDRASDELQRPYGFPAGTVTVGLHLGIAATEWHLHAWDLTTGQAKRHQPAQATELFMAAGAAMSVAKGGIKGQLLKVAVPLAARKSPWNTLLKEAGRPTNHR